MLVSSNEQLFNTFWPTNKACGYFFSKFLSNKVLQASDAWARHSRRQCRIPGNQSGRRSSTLLYLGSVKCLTESWRPSITVGVTFDCLRYTLVIYLDLLHKSAARFFNSFSFFVSIFNFFFHYITFNFIPDNSFKT